MKHTNPFFKIGTVGIILTALLHILLAFVVGGTSIHNSFFVLYPSWIAFLIIGTAKLAKDTSK